MRRLILILGGGMLVWAGVETARELAVGVFPRSLGQVFIVLAMLLAQPALQARLGRPGLVLSFVCSVIAFGLIFVAPEGDLRQLAGGRRLAEAEEPPAQAASKATLRFRSALSQGRFAEICSVAENGAFRGVTDLDCAEFLAYLHDKVGEFESNSLPAWYVEKGTDSPRVAAEMDTRYERVKARESFDWRVTSEAGRARLVSYDINF